MVGSMQQASAFTQGSGRPRRPGRPKVGSYRLETMLPKECLDELIRREEAGLGYRTRVAADVLCRVLIGRPAPDAKLPHT